ncbi:ABC transporter substrate-binding protein [Laribacter hongkongensis]|uniref:ABC transporter substrate-binding protein n=1 Tax=Laribacter hongkongensis TaxID=168471 RepID=A0ABD4STI9_9NEIS|nr:ABC transporter substrate-binding protein [Laribacter hongkongensis]MCG9026433.1 ABC transporter substrate-binding protein [Laribacter hongkongensis]MCG9057784.1 ABC transporter substrate-binding protein [Laribacter hongkongensis]MCG9085013.1 ABC transporter substrate-binding protein [Laribacter hongkongensis]MCG9100255.1 ABC transporter substrate-binding protein [Laribacter hongkongensis]MCG9103170.1 ABC transporter substrate-binding protein [Laribacter hongkongensis]
MMKKWLALMGLVTVCLLPVAAHAETADQMVRQTSREVLDIIKKENGKNTARVRAEVEAAAVPKFDFTRMTALAIGRGWRQASPEQQAQLTEQFRTLLVRTYAATMVRFKNARIDVSDNVVLSAEGREAIVRTSVVAGGADGSKPVQVDYTLYKTPAGWKVYNVSVEGASLVTVYRSNFTEILSQSGVEGLLQSLRDKNAQLAARNGAAS